MPTPEARKARTRLHWIVTALGLIVVVSLLLSGVAVKESRDVGRSSRLGLCREEQKTRTVLHDLIRDVLAATKKQPPSAKQRRGVVFFQLYLDRLNRLNCGQIAKVGP